MESIRCELCGCVQLFVPSESALNIYKEAADRFEWTYEETTDPLNLIDGSYVFYCKDCSMN